MNHMKYHILQESRLKEYKERIDNEEKLNLDEQCDFLVCLHFYFEFQTHSIFDMYKFCRQSGNTWFENIYEITAEFWKVSFFDKYKFYVLLNGSSDLSLSIIKKLKHFVSYRNAIIHAQRYNMKAQYFSGNVWGEIVLDKEEDLWNCHIDTQVCLRQIKYYHELLEHLKNIIDKDKNISNVAMREFLSEKLESVFNQES